MYLCFFLAPAASPTNIAGHAADSTTILLSWNPPPAGDQNGIIRNYTIGVTEQDTGREFSLVSGDTHEILGSLHPSYTYAVIISAVTVASGPYSTPLAVQTEEDSEYSRNHQLFIGCPYPLGAT